MPHVIFAPAPSFGARLLARSLGIRRVRNPSNLRPSDKVINWGTTDAALLNQMNVINKPSSVELAVYKSQTLFALRESNIPCVEFFTRPSQRPEGATVYARRTESGCEGRGIVIVPPDEPLPMFPLYTVAFPTHREYRVHVAGGKAILVQQKKKRNGATPTNHDLRVRNYGDVWIFAVNNLTCDQFDYRAELEKVAVDAVSALDLDFGAVDVLVSRGPRRIVVCEVNTRPGLDTDSSTLLAYKTYFEEALTNGTT